MYNVFVWVSYGSHEVYAANTPKEAAAIFCKIAECVKDWGDEYGEFIAELQKKTNPDDYPSVVRAINRLLAKINVGSDEMFEYGTGFTSVKPLSEEHCLKAK